MGKMGRPRHPDILTPREWEVLALLRARLTNEEIAGQLGITLDGAKYHVSQILSKLGVATREEAAAVVLGERRAWWVRWPLWAKIAGTATVAATVGGIGVLFWAVVAMDEPLENEIATVALTDCEFSPSVEADKLSTDAIPVGVSGSSACWEQVPNAAQYSVELAVNWYGNCEVFLSEARLSQEAATRSELARGSDHFDFPKPPDDRYTIPKDVFVDVRARSEEGSEIARGAFAVQKEVDYPSMCGGETRDAAQELAACPAERRGDNIDWVNFVQLGGVTYVSQGPEHVADATDLGTEYATVRCRLAGFGPRDGGTVDGDAAYLDPGTTIYRVAGYDPRFRIAIPVSGGVLVPAQEERIFIFEADTDPNAEVGADLLDIQDRVLYIGLASNVDGTTELASIRNPALVSDLVRMALGATVDQSHRDQGEMDYFVVFHLTDGPPVRRAYWLDSGELSRGILLPDEFRGAVESAVSAAGLRPTP